MNGQRDETRPRTAGDARTASSRNAVDVGKMSRPVSGARPRFVTAGCRDWRPRLFARSAEGFPLGKQQLRGAAERRSRALGAGREISGRLNARGMSTRTRAGEKREPSTRQRSRAALPGARSWRDASCVAHGAPGQLSACKTPIRRRFSSAGGNGKLNGSKRTTPHLRPGLFSFLSPARLNTYPYTVCERRVCRCRLRAEGSSFLSAAGPAQRNLSGRGSRSRGLNMRRRRYSR